MADAVGPALGSGVAAAKAVFDDRGEVAGLLPLYAASIINLKVLLNAMKIEAERVNPTDALLRAQIDGLVLSGQAILNAAGIDAAWKSAPNAAAARKTMSQYKSGEVSVDVRKDLSRLIKIAGGSKPTVSQEDASIVVKNARHVNALGIRNLMEGISKMEEKITAIFGRLKEVAPAEEKSQYKPAARDAPSTEEHQQDVAQEDASDPAHADVIETVTKLVKLAAAGNHRVHRSAASTSNSIGDDLSLSVLGSTNTIQSHQSTHESPTEDKKLKKGKDKK